MTYREFIDDVQKCRTKDEAAALIERETVEVLTHRPELLNEQARAIVMQNIGYMVGYLSREEAGRLLQLFETHHPYFGAIEEWPKTPEETITMGIRLGMQQARSEWPKQR